MARTVKDAGLGKRERRLKLAPARRHWRAIHDGLALGYRRGTHGSGTWCLRVLLPRGTYTMRAVGIADDHSDANGADVLNFAQAQQAALKLAGQIKREAGLISGPVTVAAAAVHYLTWFRQHRRATVWAETTINAHILPALGPRLVTELSTREIREWHGRLASVPARKRTAKGAPQGYRAAPLTEEQKRSRKATANRILSVLKALLNKAFRDELVMDDLAWRKVKPFEKVDQPATRFLKEAESIRLINACRPDFRMLVKAALFTGARYSELTRLMVKDVDTDTATIYISAEAKSGKSRHVFLSDKGLDFFKSVIGYKKGNDAVFVKKDGSPWGKNHHIRILQEACEAARIEPAIGFHDLRHTYASLLAQAGADLLTISKLLGHADTRITSRHYAHLCDKTLAHAVRTLLPDFGHQSETKVVPIR